MRVAVAAWRTAGAPSSRKRAALGQAKTKKTLLRLIYLAGGFIEFDYK